MDGSFETSPSVVFDAVVVADGPESIDALLRNGRTREFMRDIYRHGKTILSLGAGSQLLEACGLPTELPNGEPDPGVVMGASGKPDAAIEQFVVALGRHRHPERDSDPPLI